MRQKISLPYDALLKVGTHLTNPVNQAAFRGMSQTSRRVVLNDQQRAVNHRLLRFQEPGMFLLRVAKILDYMPRLVRARLVLQAESSNSNSNSNGNTNARMTIVIKATGVKQFSMQVFPGRIQTLTKHQILHALADLADQMNVIILKYDWIPEELLQSVDPSFLIGKKGWSNTFWAPNFHMNRSHSLSPWAK